VIFLPLRYNLLGGTLFEGERMTGHDAGTKTVFFLYIGRSDNSHGKVWQQFERDGYTVASARTQVEGLQFAWDLQPRVVVVNTANSGFSGDRLCRTLGRRLPGVQRLLIVERGYGANVPCELRLVRPFTGRKLRESLLKLLEASAPNTLRAGEVHLDLVSRVVNSPRGRQHLTPKQCNLLAWLMQHPNQVVSRKDLMERVWHTVYLGDTRTLDVHIRWLREKIERDPTAPAILRTQRGIGYVLRVAGPQGGSGLPEEDDEELVLD
jgi:DNA-binding response OmpR family regulator